MVEPGLDVRSPVGGVVPETWACLSDAQERAFERHARRFGHEAGRLSGAAELVSYPIVPSIAEVRELSATTPGQRRRRQQVFFNPVVELRRSIGQGVHDRLEAAVFADGTIVPADEARTGYHFPFPTRILSVRHRDVRSGESWDLSVRGDHWGLDDRDDIMNVVNVGRLRLEPGATVLVRGNLLILIVQQLICEPAEPAEPAEPGEPGGRGQYHLAILPTPFSVDNDTGPRHGPGGPAGLDGAGGAAGVGAPTERTWLGARLLGPVVPGAADGSDGGGATAGGDGARGRTGGASKLAEITIGELAGPLTILATAGRGGDGGAGGAGGRGGDGGPGAPGQRTMEGLIPPGNGGDGGPGGDGGRGGRGGHGGIASNVFVSLPPDQAAQVRVLAHPSGGGRGGRGGRGGAGGQGGAGGAHAPEPGAVGVSEPRPDGSPGLSGADGRPGRDGRARAAPPVFVNERAVEPMPAPTQVAPPDAVRSLDTRRGAVFTSTMGEEGQ
jgi:hypothetical protein